GATYNGERYLREQLDSIIRQLEAGDEVIVSDDSSSDRTVEILKKYEKEYPMIRVFVNTGRPGVNGNFENALRHAKGDFIFLADQDDVWRDDKVSVCMKALQGADLVLHDAEITDGDLCRQNKTLFSELKIKDGFWNNYIRNRFTGCCMAFRREILSYVLPFPEKVSFFHDSWIGLLVTLKGRVNIVNECLISFRRHNSNNSTAGASSRRGLLKKVGDRLSLGINLIKRVIR
ncbi:MAG: glycosyltransferase family 2 protein, partial [Muribaculaceae bacterium]|nr:glycosyltransferase family 2 protein [Muribaculaceae bacterium]